MITHILHNIHNLNEDRKANNVYTYDFSTLYTNIPHEDLKKKIDGLSKKLFSMIVRILSMYPIVIQRGMHAVTR